jgi:NAD(P)-dependent dehydrogenase (short-subunit alcohol dehydrogenase family)
MTAKRKKVAVVTGGGGGIGAAIAEQLGREGCFVVTVDPLVTIDGTAKLPETHETTANRIRALGGSAHASSVSVTDFDALRDLFNELADEHGGLDAVVNAAGINRPTSFTTGSEQDWLAVLSVHLGGYLNVLEAALPTMSAVGRGHILGVTSGSGWRPADAGAYACAKRAVAALTWQIGRCAPPGVTVNAISPIAETRMVAEAMDRARRSTARANRNPVVGAESGGLSLVSLPPAGDLGPVGAYLAGDGFGWCSGRILFTSGSEVALVDEPRLLEAVRIDSSSSLSRLLQTVVPGALSPAEATQGTTGGGNPRIGPIFDELLPEMPPEMAIRSCAVVSDRPQLASQLTAALEARSVVCHPVETGGGFGDAANRLTTIAYANGPLDAVIVAQKGDDPADVSDAAEWEQVVGSHRGIVERILRDAAWARAAADYSVRRDRAMWLVTLSDGRTPGGRSRAQASAQLARAAAMSTRGKVTAFTLSLEAPDDQADAAAAELVAYLLATPDAAGLAGAELVVDSDWFGLRSHPRPIGSVVYGGPSVPVWLDRTLHEIAGLPLAGS